MVSDCAVSGSGGLGGRVNQFKSWRRWERKGAFLFGVLLCSFFLTPQDPCAAELSDDYVIGVEDVLHIAMPGHAELSATVPVRPDGKISLPLVDDVPAAGLTPEALKDSLVALYRPYVSVPNITVIVEQINSFRVYVLGEVNSPGAYNLGRPTRILAVIALAGGFSKFAGKKRVMLLRDVGAEQQRIEVNLKSVYSGKDIDANVLLRAGDTVVVP